MRKIKNRLFKVTTNLSKKVIFFESKTEKELIEHLYHNYNCEPITVTEILKNGKTPRIPIYTHEHYKRLRKGV
jgi:hypothetical protein